MKRSPFFLLLMVLPMYAAEIGDFAPLKVGNVWVYDQLSTATGLYGGYTQRDSSTVTMKLTHSYSKNDTVFFCFSNTVNGFVVSDTVSDDKPADTGFINRTEFDTLLQIGDSIYAKNEWRLRSPVFTSHHIDSAVISKYGYVSLQNGKYECLFVFYEGSTNRTIKNIYRQDVGWYSYEYSVMIHGSGGSTNVKLRSFSTSNEPVTAIRNQQVQRPVLQHKVTGTKMLNFPHHSVERGGRQFNLLGRIDRGSAAALTISKTAVCR